MGIDENEQDRDIDVEPFSEGITIEPPTKENLNFTDNIHAIRMYFKVYGKLETWDIILERLVMKFEDMHWERFTEEERRRISEVLNEMSKEFFPSLNIELTKENLERRSFHCRYSAALMQSEYDIIPGFRPANYVPKALRTKKD